MNSELEEYREHIRRRGHVVLRGVIEEEAIAKFRSRLLMVLRQYRWIHKDRKNPVPTLARQEGSFGWWDCYEDIQRIELFHALAYSGYVLEFFRRLFGGSVLTHGRRAVSLIYPDCWIPPHQDYIYIQGAIDTFTAWVALEAQAEGSPILRVANSPPEHKLLPLIRTQTGGASIDMQRNEVNWSSVDLAPGDVAIYHSLKIHEVTPNSSSKIASFLEFRYQPAHNSICEASLKPHHFPRLAGWDEISSNWSNLDLIPPQEESRIVRYKIPTSLETWHSELDVPRSTILST